MRVGPPEPTTSATDIFIPSEGGSEIYRFDAAKRHVQTLDARTNAVRYRFAYDAAGRLSQVVDGDGDTTRIERDGLGNPAAIVAPDGQRTLLAVGADGYLALAANPAGETYRMTYREGGLLASLEDPKGNAARFGYDDWGRLTEDRDAAGNSQLLNLVLDSQGRAVTRTTPEGRTTTYRVKPLATGGQRRAVADPAGLVTVSLARPDGATVTTGPDGSVTTVVEGPDPRYGTQGSLSRLPKSLKVETGGLAYSRSFQRVADLADSNNPVGSLRKLTDTVTVNGRASTLAYDVASRTYAATSAAGRTWTATTDALGRPLLSKVPGLLDIVRQYDTRGRLAQVAQGTGVGQRVLAYGYDAQGHLASVTDPLGRKVDYRYDAAERLAEATLPDGRAVRFGHDKAGNLVSLTPPGQPDHLFRYTPLDLAQEYQPPLAEPGGSTLYGYDRDRKPARIDRPDGQAVVFGYDGAGRLSVRTTPEGDTRYGYDAATGQLTRITAPDGGALGYRYSGALLTQAEWTGAVAGTVGYAYDNDFRVREVKLNGADPVAYGYDADGLLTSAGAMALGRDPKNGLLTGTALGKAADSLAYNGFGEVAGYTAKVDGVPAYTATYTRDKLGRIVRKAETVQGAATTYDYGYDLAGRLAEVKRDGAVVAAYGYDANGNRTTVNGQAVAHYDGQDRLLDYNGATFGYTANGELQTKVQAGQATRYGYDVLGNLRHVDLPGGTAIDYLIDGQDRRIGKQVNGALVQGFLYQDGLRPVAELDGNNQTVSRFVYADKANVPAYMVKGGATYRIVSDHLGSPRLVVNVADGSVAQRMDYDEWGRVIYDSNPGFQPFGFAGGIYDRDTGLVRFGARDYDPGAGRWTAKDPIGFVGRDPNLFGYVNQDPVNHFDQNGKFCPACAIPIAIGLVYCASDLANHLPQSPLYNTEDDSSNNDGKPSDSNGNNGKKSWPPFTGPKNGYEEGPRRGREYDESGAPKRDYDKPHQGAPYDHVHEWENGVREHPGRPYSPWPQK